MTATASTEMTMNFQIMASLAGKMAVHTADIIVTTITNTSRRLPRISKMRALPASILFHTRSTVAAHVAKIAASRTILGVSATTGSPPRIRINAYVRSKVHRSAQKKMRETVI
jgi:hypothetical protein